MVGLRGGLAFSYLRYLAGRLGEDRESHPYNLCFVIFENSRGWILEGICKEVAKWFPGPTCFHYSPRDLPDASSYFFAHFAFLPGTLAANPRVWGRKRLVFFTHLRDDLGFSASDLVLILNRSSKVICMGSEATHELAKLGVAPTRTTFLLAGADPAKFRPHERGQGVVGFSSAYYPRKRPEVMLKIIRRMPQRHFVLLGKGWRAYERFAEISVLPNFTYVEADYEEYARYYAGMDVFVSPSLLEGGPISLIEAMMSNAVPVVTRTGFAPDLIEDGRNGFLLPVNAEVDAFCGAIDRAFRSTADVHATVKHLTWERYAGEIAALV
jgi:glycosyltransferase involved in cell wall biosynthesis